MQSIANGVIWHDLMPDVSLNDFDNGWLNGYQRQAVDKRNDLFFVRVVATAELVQHCNAGHKEIVIPVVVPPLARPLSARHHVWLGANLVVETGNGCLDAYSWFHSNITIKRILSMNSHVHSRRLDTALG
ncbi:MAG: hypothetical protein CVU45_07580 [Chloroflexi bacterium HGW-Chloroflexi-7]|nr:MAG: hypothetical protein CVU45_07580 [Chloroflexi bacterium HGW-Chloroflexi-7]